MMIDDTIITLLSIAVAILSFMIARDLRTLRRSERKYTEDQKKYIESVDNHDKTPYEDLISNKERDAWAEAAIRRYNVPVGIDPDKAHLFDNEEEN